MRVLLTGATGFIGGALRPALQAAGHEVVCAVRDPTAAAARLPGCRLIAADFGRDLDADTWRPRLSGIDVVVNAVGILRERGAQRFERLHTRAPIALFDACVGSGVRRVVQISALGADAQAQSRYHRSKKAADDHLATLPIASVIVRPSLVYADGGASARLFTRLASLPLVPLPGRGTQALQPIHRDDLVAALARVVGDERHDRRGERVALVGPRALSLRELLASLRRAMGLPPARFLMLPMGLMRPLARLAAWLPGSLLDRESLAMLERGNTADPAGTCALLGRAPRAVPDFVAPAEAPHVRLQARLSWLLPLLRASLALVWIGSGLVSLGLYPVQDSLALLARAGFDGPLAPLLLYAAALLDLGFGIAILALRRGRGLLWAAQAATILFYSVLIAWRLPEFWLHPYAPMLKNLPMLAAILLLQQLEPEEARTPWTT